MGFTKLDQRILQSSIMAEDPFTFKIWITLLASCGADGVAECSAMFLESICRIPLDQVKKSLEILSSTDEQSRSINDDGKRIERVDGGYRIINYMKYRELSLKSSEAERKRLYRETKKCPDISGQCPDTSASASVSDSFSVSSSLDLGVQGIFKISEFRNELDKYTEYPIEMRNLFFDYWTEPNAKKTKMRFEMEKTWEISRRLKQWASRDKNFNQEKFGGLRQNSAKNSERTSTSSGRCGGAIAKPGEFPEEPLSLDGVRNY